MSETRVTFHLEATDPAHSSGLSPAAYDQLERAVAQLGGYDLEVELATRPEPPAPAGTPKPAWESRRSIR